MKVKTADLKNNLSRYLARIRLTGDMLIVCDRDEPVATLSPIVPHSDAEWEKKRKNVLAGAKRLGLSVEFPLRRPDRLKKPHVHPTLAPDKRTDIRTIDLVRKGRDY
jgi:antitoxin (DNA-binding transcriptional repressor) of toxin-antitoxin stability system